MRFLVSTIDITYQFALLIVIVIPERLPQKLVIRLEPDNGVRETILEL